MSHDHSTEKLADFLHGSAKKGRWQEVVNEYAKNPRARNLKLTRRGDTALHLAVIDNRVEIVLKLVEIVEADKENCRDILEITNERENNALHLAAVNGSFSMCQALVSAHGELVDKRNKVDETPLYLAVMYGNKDAFFCLYDSCRENPSRIVANCRVKNEGDTVLHYALRHEQYDLAFELIHTNKDAVNWINEAGLTPLHVLASKPTSFRSGSYIKRWQQIIYHCTFVKPLQPRPNIETPKHSVRKAEATPSRFPVNYWACIEFFKGINYMFLSVTTPKRRRKNTENDEATKNGSDLEQQSSHAHQNQPNQSATEPPNANLPRNCTTCIEFFQILLSAIMIILGFGSAELQKIRKKKEKHTWSVQVMEKLLDFADPNKYADDGKTSMDSTFWNDQADKVTLPYNFVDDEVRFSTYLAEPIEFEKPKDAIETESAMLLAVKHGVIEIVKGMFEHFPLAIRDTRKDKKNAVLLAAEYRQPAVYEFLLQKREQIENLFRAVDHNGNSALHLAATVIDPKLWRITGAALQMQWEVKWYNFVRDSVPLHYFNRRNNDEKTANKILHETHKELAAKGGLWLYKTSESCTLVAALIATVAFATAATIPGGNDESGAAKLGKEPGFLIFSYSSLIALCFSSTAVIMFLAIMTSRFDIKEFGVMLPWKLLVGLFSLYFSIIAMLISFCSGHYFLIIHRRHKAAILLYSVTLLPVALIFGIVQLPLCFDLLQAIFKNVPKRSADVVLRDFMDAVKTNSELDDA